jgi:hypothetical protein
MPGTAEHRFTVDTDRCVCGGMVVYFEDQEIPGEGCEVQGRPWALPAQPLLDYDAAEGSQTRLARREASMHTGDEETFDHILDSFCGRVNGGAAGGSGGPPLIPSVVSADYGSGTGVRVHEEDSWRDRGNAELIKVLERNIKIGADPKHVEQARYWREAIVPLRDLADEMEKFLDSLGEREPVTFRSVRELADQVSAWRDTLVQVCP